MTAFRNETTIFSLGASVKFAASPLPLFQNKFVENFIEFFFQFFAFILYFKYEKNIDMYINLNILKIMI